PDFSSVNAGSAVATLISPQYIASVKHNGGYQGVSFGTASSQKNICLNLTVNYFYHLTFG
ncbi:hypothetical protein FHE25_25530, partial [Salmonella enterica]|nr:hypothetical protein [Salmonella enterica]EHA6078728.1 hypothetical protein [Salmonella enterica]EHD6971414.1 hypothetical protein [Salmonella enterica]EKS0708000.1 hypothetical protein [Salmonella enterica]HAF2306650.1 hypothetical protein [Salmonella enterica]